MHESGRHTLAALRTCGSGLRRFGGVPGPVLLAATLTLAACTSSASAPQPQVARVERTTVSTAVSSSGALATSTEQNLGFLRGGRLTAVNVKVGDRVTAGQVLATQDDTSLRRTLEQQQAQLDAQRAVLARLVTDPSVRGAVDSAAQAQAVLDATEDQARATKDADDVAVRRAERQLGFDADARDDAEKQLKADQEACAGSAGGGSSTNGTFSRRTVPSPAVARAMSALGQTDAAGDTTGTSGMSTGGTGPTGSDPTTGSTGTGTGSADIGVFAALTGPVDPAGSAACSRVPQDRTAFAQADRQVLTSRTARDSAREQRDVDEAAGAVSVENARSALVSAQNTRDANRSNRPPTIAQQQAAVAGQDAVVRQAQQDVDDTVLRAPVDGTVSALNGAVGEYVAPSAGTSALAPGSGAAIPGTDGGPSAASGSAVSRPGGTQFLVLDGADDFQVVVPFEQTDAARIAPNQNVDVTFDAVPDLVRRGTVLAVAPASTATSGIVSYYVTVLLTETDPRLRDGLTAQAAVHVEELRGVAAVPNAAVRRDGGRTTVTMVGVDGAQRTVPFTAGVVGDDLTQVVSGLSVGDEVVVPADRRA